MKVDAVLHVHSVLRKAVASLLLFTILLVHRGSDTRLGIDMGHFIAMKWK